MITSLFWGIIVQLTTLLIFSNTITLDYNNERESISNLYFNLLENRLPDLSTRNLRFALAYLLASIFIAFILGHISHLVIRGLKIDVKYRIFRFANNWHYYFKGDILKTKDFKDHRKGNVLLVRVDVIANNGDGKTKMYSGYLTDYNLTSKGDLDNIFLTSAERYSETINDFKDIPGNCLIVPYKNVQNINLTYELEEEKEKSSKKKIALVLFKILSLALFLFICTAPWYLDLHWGRKILGILVSLFSQSLIMVAIQNIISHRRAEKEILGVIILSILLSSITGLIALKILGLI